MITLRELSEIAGVSISTVSKAINNSRDIGLETKLRVQQIAQQYGYVPSKRRFNSDRHHGGPVVAVIYSDLTSSYYSRLIESLDERVHEMGGHLVMANAGFDTVRIIENMNYFQSIPSIDGILIISALNVFGELPRVRVPLVGISYPSLEIHPFDHLCVNDGVGIDEAVDTLHKKGHRRIAFISEPFTAHRLDFFKRSMARRNIEIDPKLIRVSSERFFEAGYECMKEILRETEAPTAVFGAYDDIAMGALQAIREAGLRVPEDISLLGIDDTRQSIGDCRILASVDCHIADQADIALGLLIRKIKEHDFSAVQNVSLHTNFVEHDTVAPARAQSED